MQPIKNYIHRPRLLLLGLIKKAHFLFPDRIYLRLYYLLKMGKSLNLKNPQTFNEKIQWLKLYDRNPLYTTLVDKFAVKQVVADLIGKEHVIPTLFVWNRPEDINWDLLPHQFVLKTTHGGGGCGLIICKDKDQLDKTASIRLLKDSMRNSIYNEFREWPYKGITPRIIAEPYLTNQGREIEDYKIHCFNGTPRFILLCRGRFTKEGLTEDFYSIDWRHLEMKRPNFDNPNNHKCPEELDEMIRLAGVLSKGIPFVRTDFYIIDKTVYFGELTFFPASGMGKFEPAEWDAKLGGWLVLPEKTEHETE